MKGAGDADHHFTPAAPHRVKTCSICTYSHSWTEINPLSSLPTENTALVCLSRQGCEIHRAPETSRHHQHSLLQAFSSPSALDRSGHDGRTETPRKRGFWRRWRSDTSRKSRRTIIRGSEEGDRACKRLWNYCRLVINLFSSCNQALWEMYVLQGTTCTPMQIAQITQTDQTTESVVPSVDQVRLRDNT